MNTISDKEKWRQTHRLACGFVRGKADYINFEEDLGINGLRTFKRRLHPIQMLDMYRAYPVQAA